MAKEVVVTREGYDKLVHDLDELRTVKRKEVADKIKVARGYGDLELRTPSTTPLRKSRPLSRPASLTWRLP